MKHFLIISFLTLLLVGCGGVGFDEAPKIKRASGGESLSNSDNAFELFLVQADGLEAEPESVDKFASILIRTQFSLLKGNQSSTNLVSEEVGICLLLHNVSEPIGEDKIPSGIKQSEGGKVLYSSSASLVSTECQTFFEESLDQSFLSEEFFDLHVSFFSLTQ
ncbi:MAG: hypothetical protein HRU19_17535 [Pseudobacteriovorax sp.]|nr:hypothetical protein [Pseudobacteriovorax sp.]